MDFSKIIFVIISALVLQSENVRCQFEEFPSFFNEFPSSIKAARDPRQDRGPVLFPQAPVGPETSGVRVGASGFGFVPPTPRGRVIGALGAGPNALNEYPFW